MTMQEKDIIDKIKAAMAPVLIGIISFFMVNLYRNYEAMSQTQQLLLIELREYKASTGEKIKALELQVAELKQNIHERRFNTGTN